VVDDRQTRRTFLALLVGATPLAALASSSATVTRAQSDRLLTIETGETRRLGAGSTTTATGVQAASGGTLLVENGAALTLEAVAEPTGTPTPTPTPTGTGTPTADPAPSGSRDPDGDGRFQDYNGDGSADFFDVIDLLFDSTESRTATPTDSPPATGTPTADPAPSGSRDPDGDGRFEDYNGDGSADFFDVIDLLFDLPSD
jgi:hypothetical protein